MTTTSEHEIPNPIGLELTHDQGYALANLLSHLNADFILRYSKSPTESLHMVRALSELKVGLEDAGYYPSEDTESPDA